MRTRNNRISLYLNDKEMETLKKKVRSTGLTCNSYLRMLIKGYGPVPSPDEKFWPAMESISTLASRIDEIGIQAETPADIIAALKEAREWRYLRNEIEKEFLRPKKIDEAQIIRNDADSGE